MKRNTIDFGIDLGTTNSEIAVIDGTRTEIIKNNLNMEFTPSAVFIDKSNRIHVGQKAKDRYFFEEEDGAIEFKRNMGTDQVKTFASSGRTMKPEELSAEILKALKADVTNRLNGEVIQSAVITVPAAFELPQNEATLRAARLAGLENCVLLQEPIAAALAYGFQSKSDRVFWMVYDFGGGTFDATIVQLRDGLFRVLYHDGDNFLGGKDLDRSIIDEIVVPEVIKQSSIPDFNRSNGKYKTAYAKLKIAVESTKIQLSVEESSPLVVDDLIKESGFDFEMDLHRNDVAKLAKPMVNKSIRICKDVIKNAGLKPGDIEKLILVGGPTIAPYVRDMLGDPIEGLGIPLEFSVDPLTVVARGAAIFAGGQLIENKEIGEVEKGTFQLKLEYQPIGSDPEPQIGGRVESKEIQDFSGFTIEIKSASYQSGRIALGKNGGFISSVFAEGGKQNLFQVDLFDNLGTKRELSPNSFTYTIGNAPSNPPLTSSMGVALSTNEVVWFLKKGTPLPGRSTKILKTSNDLKQNESGNFVIVPVIEGMEETADLNRLIGKLQIPATNIKRDVPAGSEIEVTIKIDKSRIVSVSAYVPLLDLDISEIKFDTELFKPNLEHLKNELRTQENKIKELRGKAEQTNESTVIDKLNQIEKEKNVQEIERSLNEKEATEGEKRVLDLKKAIVNIENDLEWPGLVKKSEEIIEESMNFAEKQGDDALKEKIRNKQLEIHNAISAKDAHTLKRCTTELNSIHMDSLTEKPEFWVGFFYYLSEDCQGEFDNKSRADELLQTGEQAIQNGNLDRLKGVVISLMGLLPREKQEEITKGYGSTVTK